MAGPPPRDPRDPWYRRCWGYDNHPYNGFGCLWTILIFIVPWWVLSFCIRGLVFW